LPQTAAVYIDLKKVPDKSEEKISKDPIKRQPGTFFPLPKVPCRMTRSTLLTGSDRDQSGVVRMSAPEDDE
jgi:hypothetical protein